MREYNGYKLCYKCKNIYPIIMFNKDISRCDNLHNKCIECESIYNRKRDKTEKRLQHHRKMTAIRKRNFGFEVLFINIFPNNIKVDWHHVSDGFVIAIPTFTHRQYYGPNHREKLKPIIEKLYNISYIII